ncbi:hypothetical protein PHYBOEH_010555 [Phytophthora boehmeriae]|uniref:Uncharacterized protein n=1 Tax=Phytophthora boehmeriae TaxID=109152 RepID=A0A8T1VMU1_9STRA|nr:hypothetical protein PHYBOEH_010555 [Phytophthora boehmeriae]
MARTAPSESPRSAADVLQWLRRCRQSDLSVDRVLDVVRSAAGVVPLGGRVGGSDGATPPVTPKGPLTYFNAPSDGETGPDQDEKKRWSLLLSSCQLPASGGPDELKKALETLHKAHQGEILSVRAKFYDARRAFFSVRIELLRVARQPQHPSAQAAVEIVDELLKEGLREALLDEVHGRQFYRPPKFDGVGASERQALVAWELQFLEEEALLRELLLLTLVASNERATLESAVKLAKTVHGWENRVFDDIFTASTLALPEAQALARRVTQVGVMVVLRMLHTTGAGQQHRALQQVTQSFFLGELCGITDAMEDKAPEPTASPVPGVFLLAWAALLGRRYGEVAGYGKEGEKIEELKNMLQQTLVAAEQFHSFQYLNALLRSLVFSNDEWERDTVDRQATLQPLSLSSKTLWSLPNVAAPGRLRRGLDAAPPVVQGNSAAVFQQVVAMFLNDMLSSLGYMENLEGGQQLQAMVRFVLPALSNSSVARQILGIDAESNRMVDDMSSDENAALRDLLETTRANLPHSLLPCVQMFAALCCNYQDVSSPDVLHQVLKYFNEPRAGLEGRMITSGGAFRQLPPHEYFVEVPGSSERVECTRSFAYDEGEDRLVVPAGTVGVVSRSRDEVLVEWHVSNHGGSKTAPNVWDLVMLTADNIIGGLQSGSLIDLHRTNAEDISVLTAFFEFIVQLGQQRDGGQSAVGELERRWGEARLRRWWLESRLPSPEVYVPQLMNQRVTLPMVLVASRENLVSWGVRDRHTREQILAQLGNDTQGMAFGGSDRLHVTDDTNPFGADGGIHLLRLLLGILDGFLHSPSASVDDDMAIDGEGEWPATHLHLVRASFSALRVLLATPTGVQLFMNPSLGGGREECLNLIVKSAKKLFELQERLAGEYPVVLATQEIFISVVRWFLAKEAHTLANPVVGDDLSVGSHMFIATERSWFVGAAEFSIEVLSTHESWKFVSTSERYEITERCFRLLHVLVLPRKYIHEENEMIPAFDTALRETLSTDMSLLMKLLRSSCAVLSSMQNCLENDTNSGEDKSNPNNEDTDTYFPLVYESEIINAGATVMQLESVVTTCLRLLASLLANQNSSVDPRAARKILLTPIDDGRSHKCPLTLVTLCGGYIGYSLENAPGIAYWSLQILQHAAVILDYREERESRDISTMHSLVTLFHGSQDLTSVRGTFARLLRASSPRCMSLRKEIVVMLTLCLEHQPGFLALLLFGSTSNEDATSEENSLPFVTLLDRFFVSSEQLLEQSSDLFCALLTFLVQVWQGAIHNGLGIHLKIMAAFRARSTFWPNVTRALKIHMPLESVDERGVLDMELAAATEQGRGDMGGPSSSSEAYIGRSSPYGYLARGLILQLVSYEWHNQASWQNDHPLLDVLESFRKEGLYSHWLRTFTRLDYSPAQLEQYAASIGRACSLNVSIASLLNELPVGSISTYLQGLICDTSALKWQLSVGGDIKLLASPSDIRMLKLIKWSNLQAAYLHAQLFSLRKWKVFMELFCLQDDSTAPTTATAGTAKGDTTATTAPRRLKRKESMISSPPRSSVASGAGSTSSGSRPRLTASSSVSSSESALASSRFSGDRTSFGMIQVLADVIKSRVDQHETQDEVLDFFVLQHLHDLMQLLVSMLHHQLCVVVRKTRDPKLSQTRHRIEASEADPNLKLGAAATLVLLGIIEKTEGAVRESMGQMKHDVELARLNIRNGDKRMSAPAATSTTVPLIARLVSDFEREIETLTEELHTSLFTAGLLLVRHLRKVSDNHDPPSHASRMVDGDTEMESATPSKTHLQVKMIAHCMNAISLCDAHSHPTKATQTLFHLSWSLFQEVLDSFGNTEAKLKLRMANVVQLSPFVKELEHDQQGIGALFHLLVQRFRTSSSSKEVMTKQEEACQVLRGLAAVVWNPDNAALCQSMMLSSDSSSYSSRLQLLSVLASQLLPLLQTQMKREEEASALRGYVAMGDGEDKRFQRSVAHRTWCFALDFASGLIRLHMTDGDEGNGVWEFVSHAEALLLAAVDPKTCQRLTRALVTEHQSLLRFVSALSGTTARRKRWRQAFPSNSVVLMEQSRQLLRRACVLLGSSSTENDRLRRESTLKTKQGQSKSVVGFGASLSLLPKSPRSPRSPSGFTFAHQTLLHDHLQAVRDVEKRQLTDFHRAMENELVEIVRLASVLLTKWTSALTDRDAILVVDGVRYVDEEQLVPLLECAPPSDARTMTSDPSLGHLCIAMEFMLDQLTSDDAAPTSTTNAVLTSAIDTCALLFLKTYMLHVEQYELVKRDRSELNSFFRKFNGRLSGDDNANVDSELIQHISKIIAG